MGDFAIKVNAVGGHNATTGPCNPPCKEGHACVDCKAAELVDWMKSKGYSVSEATFHHWPSAAPTGDHIDDLLTKTRIR